MVNNYREMRKRAGFTSTQAAANLNVSVTTLMNWEQGKTSPKCEKLVDMMKLYSCTANELLGLS